MDAPARILVVDDEESIRTLLAFPLRRDGHDVVTVASGTEALEQFERVRPDLVLLDVMLPGMDGVEVCRRLREKSPVPIIMLSARGEESDRIAGLENGADDYVTKPFSVRELRSRVRAALRRAALPAAVTGTAPPIEIADLRVDPDRRRVEVRGEEVELTHLEFELLVTMARAPGRVFTRDMLLEHAWGGAAYRERRTVDVHVLHLREKIERNPKAPEYVITVRGLGYRFRDA
ncbi:Phosphate regulon transcriptional regulatory protein PhoB (SphR) [Patulibacter medicamentivorans]|uniref:Phosphate regulon transcriptional regulatory protein PhoB (SphR) n=1 Tax=Patulibacter medicamentivorans TaxID=1097667 RepID=H0E9M9_9ACTN|nr:response regulator transcription factor [Patulibacter medicamentivorans]EHN09616.1 Phosphate regulon transcriptional regulatory protein PhoB (SphR) [Patulibacter medicamentivorans]